MNDVVHDDSTGRDFHVGGQDRNLSEAEQLEQLSWYINEHHPMPTAPADKDAWLARLPDRLTHAAMLMLGAAVDHTMPGVAFTQGVEVQELPELAAVMFIPQQPNDRQRLVRALELLATTGQPPSALYAAQQTRRPPWPTLAIGLNPARAVLHQRIGERFHAMIAEGLIDEVAALKTRPQLSLAAPSMRSVGYRQIWQYLDGACDRATAIEQAIIASSQLAKRQITWMNNRLGRELAICQYDPLANPAAPLLAVEKYLQQPPVKPI